MRTVPTATTGATGASAGSLQVSAVAPERAAGLLLIKTVALPLMMEPRLDGGMTKVPPMGTCGGVLVAGLPTVAAGMCIMFTVLRGPPAVMPLRGWGGGGGGPGPRGGVRWMYSAGIL